MYLRRIEVKPSLKMEKASLPYTRRISFCGVLDKNLKSWRAGWV